jgi:hypothetical protein
MAENIYKDKIISVLGDSISTFRGVIPEKNAARYPQDDLLTEVDLTWWSRVIAALSARLGFNDSWAGSQVSNILDARDGNIGYDTCMANPERIKNLSLCGDPDIIFLFGGTNDLGRALYPVGAFDEALCPSAPDYTRTKWQTFIDGYIEAVLRIRDIHPHAELICLVPGYVRGYFAPEKADAAAEELIKLCDHFGVRFVDLRADGITKGNADVYLPDGLHPNAEGMKLIADCILGKILS